MCPEVFEAASETMRAAFWLVLVGGMLWMFRVSPRARRRRSAPPIRRSMEVLNERYARGEIDRDEYLERRAFLE